MKIFKLREILVLLFITFILGTLLCMRQTSIDYYVQKGSSARTQIVQDKVPDGYLYTRAVPYHGWPFTAFVGLHENAQQTTESKLVGILGNYALAFTVPFLLTVVYKRINKGIGITKNENSRH